MIGKIKDEDQYNNIMASIEKAIKKAADIGGFSFLSESEKEELSHLSLLAEEYEDTHVKIMPLF